MRKLYVIRDVLEGYGVVPPGVPMVIDLANDEVAVRVVKDSLVEGQKPNLLNVHPEDKELWCIGEFDQLTGLLTTCVPYCVAKCIDYIGKVEDGEKTEIVEEEGC